MILEILAAISFAWLLYDNYKLEMEVAKLRGYLEEISDEALAEELLPDEQLRWPNMGQFR